MTPKIVVIEPVEVDTRLAQIGLREEPLREALRQAHLQRSRLTLNHPKIFAGLEMWGWGVAALREQLRPSGWVRADEGNFSLTVHESLGLAIVLAAGDEATGNPHATPSNRSRKGRNTVDAVEMNQQVDMFADSLPHTREEAQGNDTWVLLHFTDLAKQEIRCELSRPSDIGDDGKIRAWSERIILGSILLDDDSVEVAPPSGPNIDIEIRRKA